MALPLPRLFAAIFLVRSGYDAAHFCAPEFRSIAMGWRLLAGTAGETMSFELRAILVLHG